MPFRRSGLSGPHFPVGGPVPGGDLVGREAFLRGIVGRLADGNNLLLGGPRRIGKTSIALEALRRLGKRGALTAYVDCAGATDIGALGERIADAALAPLTGTDRSVGAARTLAAGGRPGGRVKVDALEPAQSLARETTGTRFFDNALDVPRAVAARSGKHVVVALDEFQAAGRLGPRTFDVMRAHFQAQRGVTYLFLGSQQGLLEELFGERGRAFYRFAIPQDLVGGTHRFGIDPADWTAYLQSKFGAKKVTLGESDVDGILDATGGHPQDTMQLCAALLYFMREYELRAVTADLVAIAYEQTMRELERPFALQWEELGSQKYLQAVAKRVAHAAVLYAATAEGAPVPRPEVLRALEGLRERGLVTRIGRGKYEFIEPMLGDYVRRLDTGIVRLQ